MGHAPYLTLFLNLHTNYCRLKSRGRIVARTSISKRIFPAILGTSLMGLMPVTVADAASPESEAQNGAIDENLTQIANIPSWQDLKDVLRNPRSLAGTKIAPSDYR
jgi:hypothetical protein